MNFIVAVDKNWGIGENGELLFRLRGDMRYFKMLTEGKVVIMGINTLRSLPGSKPLKNRKNIVLSSRYYVKDESVTCIKSLSELSKELKKYDPEDVFVIGGAKVYDLLLPYCEYGFVTKINSSKPADRFLKNLDTLENWKNISAGESIEENGINYSFNIYKNEKVKTFDENILEK